MNLSLNFTQNILNILPTHCLGTNEANVSKLLYRCFYQLENNQLQNDLVKKEIHSEDFTNWIITIESFSWSNGSSGSVNDVINTWKYIIKKNLNNASYLLDIKGAKEFQEGVTPDILGLEIIDTYTVSITFNNPFPYFKEILLNLNLSPVKMLNLQTELRPYGLENFKNEEYLITNNHHFIKKWDEDELIIESDKKSRTSNRYKFTFCNDSELVLKRIQTNDLHIHDGGLLPSDQIYESSIRYLKYYDFLSTYYLFLNMKRENRMPLNLRRNLMRVIHQDNKFITDVDKVQTQQLVPVSLRTWGNSHKDLETYSTNQKYDGLSNPLIFICNDEISYINLAKKIIKLWEKELGIVVELRVYGWDEFIYKLSKGEYDISRGGWVADFPHAYSFYEVMSSTSYSNYSNWHNEEFDNLLSLSGCTNDQNKLNNYFSKMDKLITENVPIIPIYEHKLRQLISSGVSHFDISNTGIINYDGTHLNFKGGEIYEKDRSS
ncbi:ABC transporter substrate-binding protein [Priestia koreensis]|uniref:ABC transporter substrate-binding protein n=1 Tax=Priestia koreensis TaxID=284581 RepID=UPI001F59E2B3|nr:ABC transporter substrate-binding protein [Priestia koreensis]UNL87536.1 hypothetical protein IE339_23820 [Priestia koreensis]